jgi:hypothetical protein
LIHIDDHFGVYARAELTNGKYRHFKVLRPLAAPNYLMQLSDLDARIAGQEARSLIKTAPVYANLTLGVLALRTCVKDLSPLNLARPAKCDKNTALPYFERLIKLRPSTALFHYLLAGALSVTGHRSLALRRLESCQDFDPCRGLKILLLRQ